MSLFSDRIAQFKNQQKLKEVRETIKSYEDCIVELRIELKSVADRIKQLDTLFVGTAKFPQWFQKDYRIVYSSHYQEWYKTMRRFWDIRDNMEKCEYMISVLKQREQELQGTWK